MSVLLQNIPYDFGLLGGTIDITVHEVTETGDLRELCKASGGAWGGTRVDAAFRTVLDDMFGKYCSGACL